MADDVHGGTNVAGAWMRRSDLGRAGGDAVSWPLVKLGEVVNFVGGAQPPKSEFIYEKQEGYVRLVQTRDYKSDKNLTYIPFEKARRFCTKKDVMIGRYGPPVFQILRGIEGSYNVALMKADPTSLVDREYLYYFLKQKQLFKLIDGLSQRTSGQTGIDMDALKSYPMLLPSLAEQQRIAAILDKADAIRRKRQQAIQLADDFLRAVFLDMFGDPNSNSKNSPVLPMTEVFNIKTGSLNSNAAVEGGKYPFFTCAKEVFAIDDYAFDQEALLLAGNNAQADYDVKHYKGKFNAYQRTYVLTLANTNWSYPFYKFALEYQLSNLKRVSKGSNTKYITMEIMGRTMLPVPSETEQKIFVQYFERIRNIGSSMEKQRQESRFLFSSLSQKAFSGKL